MKKNKMMIIALMSVFCILLWGIFFMLGIKTIGAVLVPIALCLLCWGAGVVYEKVIDRTGESKKVAVTMLLLVLLGILSVLFLSEGKDIAGKVVSFIFPSVLGGAIFAGGRVGAKCKESFDEKKLASYKGGALGIGVASLLLYAFIVLNRHVIGTVNDVWQMIVFAVIFFIAGFYEKTSESKSEDSEENAEEKTVEEAIEESVEEKTVEEAIIEAEEEKTAEEAIENSVEDIAEEPIEDSVEEKIVEEAIENNVEDIAEEAIEDDVEEQTAEESIEDNAEEDTAEEATENSVEENTVEEAIKEAEEDKAEEAIEDDVEEQTAEVPIDNKAEKEDTAKESKADNIQDIHELIKKIASIENDNEENTQLEKCE